MIEIDGDRRLPVDQAEYDNAGARWLEERGYRVIRLTAEQVEEDHEGVVEVIRETCDKVRGACRGRGPGVSSTGWGDRTNADRASSKDPALTHG